MFYRLFAFVVLSVLFPVSIVWSQDKPIGAWRSFLSYNSAISVAANGTTLYTATEKAFYTFNALDGQVDAYSKVEGMSDIGMQRVGYDVLSGTAILAYSNGNIDLFKDNTFYNLPELKIRTVAGAKNINDVYAHNGYAYLSTSLGIIVLDLQKQNIKESYEFNVNSQIMSVRSTYISGDSIYAATEAGLYRANVNSPELQNFQIWDLIDSTKDFRAITGVGETVFVSNSKSVYRVANSDTQRIYTSPVSVSHIDAGQNVLFISEYDSSAFDGWIRIYDVTNGSFDSIVLKGHHPLQVAQLVDGSLYIADQFGGLLRQYNDKSLGYVAPTGPLSSNSYDIYANNSDLWIAHGGFNEKFEPSNNHAGIANYNGDKWKYYTGGVYRPFDTLSDFSVLLRDKGVLYAGSFKYGLAQINEDGSMKLYHPPAVFDRSIALSDWNAQVAGLGKDSRGNLWVSTMFSPNNQLYVRTPDEQWAKFKIANAQYGGPLVIDDYDRVWFVGYFGSGVNVYDAGGTALDKSDDVSYHLGTGKGFGNLPSNDVNCIAVDKNNNIWIGTANGIGIVSNCTLPATTNQLCDAEIPVVQYDQYAGYLFADNNVRAIAVDGANRKWVGTDDGIWLLSPDAGKIVYRFTTDNSPLPSNRIQKIAVDAVTGDVYIGTDQGLVSYRSTATEGGTTNSEVTSYPNPVPSGYTGTVAIRGLVANADVRITDINGQLVYRTKALGGQAVWNGLDYKGNKPQSGVYLIFASDSNGEEKYTGKLVLLK